MFPTSSAKPSAPYIVIEGNIGAGKTSLCRRLSDELSASLLLENFDENPYLPLFYEQPQQYALQVELFFMTERHEQMRRWIAEQAAAKSSYCVADYTFAKILLFARRNLPTSDWALFERLFHALNAHLPLPDLLVYLHRPVAELLDNIRRRARAYEQNISADYLKGIERAYFDFFEQLEKAATRLPVLILDVEGVDFVNNHRDYEIIKAHLQKSYPAGLHTVASYE